MKEFDEVREKMREFDELYQRACILSSDLWILEAWADSVLDELEEEILEYNERNKISMRIWSIISRIANFKIW